MSRFPIQDKYKATHYLYHIQQLCFNLGLDCLYYGKSAQQS